MTEPAGLFPKRGCCLSAPDLTEVDYERLLAALDRETAGADIFCLQKATAKQALIYRCRHDTINNSSYDRRFNGSSYRQRQPRWKAFEPDFSMGLRRDGEGICPALDELPDEGDSDQFPRSLRSFFAVAIANDERFGTLSTLPSEALLVWLEDAIPFV